MLNDVVFVGIRLAAGLILGAILGAAAAVVALAGGSSAVAVMQSLPWAHRATGADSGTEISSILIGLLGAFGAVLLYLGAYLAVVAILGVRGQRGWFAKVFFRVVVAFGLSLVPLGLLSYGLLHLSTPNAIVWLAIVDAGLSAVASGVLVARLVWQHLDSLPATPPRTP